MGEVYRARDPRLNRDVAIKVSAERFAGRSPLEAQAIAALNHPNICTVHDVGPNYLVMELLEGETLASELHRARCESLMLWTWRARSRVPSRRHTEKGCFTAI